MPVIKAGARGTFILGSRGPAGRDGAGQAPGLPAAMTPEPGICVACGRPTTYGAGMEQLAPLILVDVDGVLNPDKPGAGGYRRHWVFPNGVAHRLLLDPGHGRMLSELAEAAGAELVWASYWRNRANTWIAPRIGLPSLRFVPIPSRWTSRARSSLGQWKALHVAAWIGQTPFVWFEDDPNVPSCLTQQPGLGRHLTVTVDPAIGLTRRHIEQARRWLDDLRAHPDHPGGTAESSPH
jgi:hypothetical protein